LKYNSLIENGQYNIGYLCTELQCKRGLGEKTAFKFIDSGLGSKEFSFSELNKYSNKFANTLIKLGFVKSDVIFTFLPKSPEQFFTFLGILKTQCIAGTLFSNFGEDALFDRLIDSGAKCIITKKSLLKKVLKISDSLKQLKHIIVIDIQEHIDGKILSYKKLIEESNDEYLTPITEENTPSVLHYTSGSTGKPKGVLHCHKSIVLQSYTSESILNLNKDDVYWCTADQGWVTGTSYGIIGPWSLGVTQIHFGGAYEVEKWFHIIENEKITIWYTAPTALRMIMREPDELIKKFNLSSLKHIFSVGEPLNPEIIHWSNRVFNKDVYDTWFQTETGSIMISNRPGIEIKLGSMGQPVGNIKAEILTDDGNEKKTNEIGNLCVESGWESMFLNYLNNESIYNNKFKNGFYYSGDLAYKDKDGYFWFIGRNDDVINTAGHLISPFEIESALLEIPEIAESAIIAAPDEILYEKIVAFVRVRNGYEWSDDLELKIRLYLSNKLSTIATPKEILVIDEIPKNRSGKIMRRLLKANYLGTDAGDLSTMEIN
jgi:acetyl-CoA synthetase